MAKARDAALRRILLGTLYLVSLALIAFLFWEGRSYYALSDHERVLPLHRGVHALLTAGGEWGHLFGIVGSILIVLLLLYIPRKRWKRLSRWGSLSVWLDVHIWMGITGPLLIVLHSAFKVQGLVAFSFWSMAAVALSGVLGRYLYLQIPRDDDGEELDNQGILRREESLLVEAGLGREDLPAVIRGELDRPIGGLFAWLGNDLAWPGRRRRWQVALQAAGIQRVSEALAALRRLEVLQRRRSTLDLARRMLHHWHVFHRPFAVIMVFFMLVHIVVVMLFKSSHGVGL